METKPTVVSENPTLQAFENYFQNR